FANVKAMANQGAYAAYNGKKDADGTLLTEDVYGVSVTSNSFLDVLTLAVAGAAGANAGSGSATIEILNETSKAHIDRGAKVNVNTTGANALQGVNVHATNYSRAITGAGGIAIGGSLGVGAALDVGSLHKDTEAYIADATVKSASFAASSVDTTNNTVEFGVPHGWTTGQPVIYNN